MSYKNGYVVAGVFFILISSCINQKKFESIRIIYEKDQPVSPNMELPFGVVAQSKNGKKVVTKGYLKGSYAIEKFDVKITNGSLKETEAVVVVDSLESAELNRSIKIVVAPVKKPSLKDSVYIPYNYSGVVFWSFNGTNGENGDDKSARVLPVKIGGTAISDGKPGESGSNGGDGEDLKLYVRKVIDDSFFKNNGYHAFYVTVKTAIGDFSRSTYIGERHGKLILQCAGGTGGNGGNGGRGVHGRDGTETKEPGNGTDGGSGGNGGNGGNGGKVIVYIDSSAKSFLPYLVIQNQGGPGGAGGLGGAGGSGGSPAPGFRTGGSDGRAGSRGMNGQTGNSGGEPQFIWRNDLY